jgi:hypothetical protein
MTSFFHEYEEGIDEVNACQAPVGAVSNLSLVGSQKAVPLPVSLPFGVV